MQTKFLVEKHEENRPLGRFQRKWEDIIKMVLNKYDGTSWNHLIFYRIQWHAHENTVMDMWDP